MHVSPEWTEYARAAGIPDASLPANHEEIIALRQLLTTVEEDALVKINAAPSPQRDDVTVKTVYVPGRDSHQIRCLVYIPKAKGPHPVYFFIHGGGWVVGRPETDDLSNRNLCLQNNVLIVSPDYRLAPENPFPKPISDCEDALIWTRDHAQDFGGDVSGGITLGGFSAGGHLAATLTARARHGRIPVHVRGLILRSAWLSDWRALSPALAASLKAITENANAPYVTTERLMLMLEWFGVPERERTDPFVFPLNLSEEQASKLPPVFVQVSCADPLRDDGVAFFELVRKAGVPARLFRYEGMPHGFHAHSLPTGLRAEEEMRKGFEWIQKESSGPQPRL